MNGRFKSLYGVTVTLIGVFAWLVHGTLPQAPVPMALKPVPTELGLWSGSVIETDPRALALLETENVILREYRLGEEPPVWFAQVAGFGQRAAYHPPEICYIGSNFEILERGPVSVFVNGGQRELMRLVIAQDGIQYESWYWFTAGSRKTSNYYVQQLWLLWDTIQRNPMSGKLIRVSTELDDPLASRRRLLAFVTSFDAAPIQLAKHGI